MNIFKLPDLGEGLPSADIREWYVNVGDTIDVDQPLVAMETAKALVDVPSPYTGKIEKLFGQVGDTIETGQPLVGFEGESTEEAPVDAGTVVGKLETSDAVVSEQHASQTPSAKTTKTTPQPSPAAATHLAAGGTRAATRAGTATHVMRTTRAATSVADTTTHVTETTGALITAPPPGVKASPAVRALARRLGVDLGTLTLARGERITLAQIHDMAQQGSHPGGALPTQAESPTPTETTTAESGSGYRERLSPALQAMVLSMTTSHQQVVPVSLVDEVDIHAWYGQADVTVRVIQSICDACRAVPKLNSYFDAASMTYESYEHVHLGLAIDSPHGLFVPVIKDANEQSAHALRETINAFKTKAQDKTFTQADLQNATLILSNFGSIAGRFATPVIIPPMVAIIATGKIRHQVIPYEGEVAIHPVLPLSLTTDHRLVTGGETARFMQAMIQSLQVA